MESDGETGVTRGGVVVTYNLVIAALAAAISQRFALTPELNLARYPRQARV